MSGFCKTSRNSSGEEDKMLQTDGQTDIQTEGYTATSDQKSSFEILAQVS